MMLQVASSLARTSAKVCCCLQSCLEGPSGASVITWRRDAAYKRVMNKCPTLLPAVLHGGQPRQPVSLQQFAEGRTGFGDYLRQWRAAPGGLTGPQKTASRCDHFTCAPHGKFNCQHCKTVIVCVSTCNGIARFALCIILPCTP